MVREGVNFEPVPMGNSLIQATASAQRVIQTAPRVSGQNSTAQHVPPTTFTQNSLTSESAMIVQQFALSVPTSKTVRVVYQATTEKAQTAKSASKTARIA